MAVNPMGKECAVVSGAHHSRLCLVGLGQAACAELALSLEGWAPGESGGGPELLGSQQAGLATTRPAMNSDCAV